MSIKTALANNYIIILRQVASWAGESIHSFTGGNDAVV